MCLSHCKSNLKSRHHHDEIVVDAIFKSKVKAALAANN